MILFGFVRAASLWKALQKKECHSQGIFLFRTGTREQAWKEFVLISSSWSALTSVKTHSQFRAFQRHFLYSSAQT
jgi:hypothetical protein